MAAAETKRNSIAGRVATPKVNAAPAQGPGESADVALGRAIGARVGLTLKTAAGESTLEGTLFTACPITNLVAINTASTPSPGDFHVVPIAHIQSFQILSLADGSSFEAANPPIAKLDTRALEAREQAAIRKIREHDASRGKGVSKEAQTIFDALSRTLPSRWHETSMIINDNVIIKEPYGLENCSAPKGQEKSLERVKRVLENERRKIAERSNNGAKNAPPVGTMRKGG